MTVFANFNSTLAICLRLFFIEMLDNCITYSMCWYNSLHQILPVARKYHITTRRFEMLVHTTDTVDLAFILGLRASNLNSNSIGIPFANFNSTLAICLKLFLLKC